MKYILLFLAFLATTCGYGQEVVSETAEYLTYQDSLFVLKTTTITNQGIEGLNDTTVTYGEPVDSAGVVSYVGNIALNDVLSRTGAMRQAYKFRRVLATFAAYDNVLSNVIGASLYTYSVQQFRGDYLGRWRVVGDTTDVVVNLIDHPNNSEFMRLTEVNGSRFWNVRIFSRDLFSIINFEGATRYLEATGENNLFAPPGWWIPPAMGGTTTGARAIKQE